MNGVDYVILGTLGLSGLISLMRGFVREALSLIVWACAFGLAWTYFRDISAHLTPWIQTPSLRLAAGFLLVLLACLLLGGLVTWLIGQLVDKTGLSGTDRLLGALFGVARGMLLVCILVLLAGLTPLPQDPWWQESRLIVHFQRLAVWLLSLLPPDVASYFHFLQKT
jgi:membrane protein required for colicin V production